MSILQEIQESVLQNETKIGPILLKLRLLAARLGSEALEEWVKYESEGYPNDISVPNYRKIPVTYTASFSGPYGSGINNAPIAPYLIEKFAGEKWVNYELRQSIAAVDELLETSSQGKGTLGISASNLILLLQGKVYEDYACNDVQGSISRSSLHALQHAVKSRVLELTIELEKSIPLANEITISKRIPSDIRTSAEVTQITNQVFYGNVTSITNTGENAKFLLKIDKGNNDAFKKYLIQSGITSADAEELSEIVASEKSENKNEPLGLKAKNWLAENLKKANDGTWKIGVTVATEVIKEAALKYYGLS